MIGIVCAVIGATATIALSDTINKAIADNPDNVSINIDTSEINIAFVSFEPDFQSLIDDGNYALIFAIICIFVLVILIIMYVMFSILKSIFKDIENSETPFSYEVLRKVKKLFIVIVLMVLISSDFGSALLAALLFRCIYCILDYGCAIQTEVDETL